MSEGGGRLLELLTELERLVVEGRRVPLTGRVMIAEEDVFAVIDEIRRALPEDVLQAQAVLREAGRITAEAREQAERVLASAREQAASLVGESEIARRAEAQAAAVVEDAKRMAREIRAGANEYADEVLARLEGNLRKTLETVVHGRAELHGHPSPRSDRKDPA